MEDETCQLLLQVRASFPLLPPALVNRCYRLAARQCPTFCSPMDCIALQAPRSLRFPCKNTGVGCHFLLQGIFPTPGSNPGLLHCSGLFTIWDTREAKQKRTSITKVAVVKFQALHKTPGCQDLVKLKSQETPEKADLQDKSLWNWERVGWPLPPPHTSLLAVRMGLWEVRWHLGGSTGQFELRF